MPPDQADQADQTVRIAPQAELDPVRQPEPVPTPTVIHGGNLHPGPGSNFTGGIDSGRGQGVGEWSIRAGQAAMPAAPSIEQHKRYNFNVNTLNSGYVIEVGCNRIAVENQKTVAKAAYIFYMDLIKEEEYNELIRKGKLIEYINNLNLNTTPNTDEK